MSNSKPSLPPGFRFHPTDEELILHYLRNKVASTPCPVSIIAEVNIYKFNPWDLPVKAAFGDREWYFFSPRDRKYPNGDRPNRAAASGYWKATGTDKVIVGREKKENIGVKKALVFYKGKPPKGLKTNWIMHEYRLAESFNSSSSSSSNNISNKRRSNDRPMRLDDWVLCRIYMKSNSPSTMAALDREKHEPLIENAFTTSFPSITNQPSFHQSSANSVPLTDYSLPTQFLSDKPSESTRSQQDPVFADDNLNSSSYILPDLPEQGSYDANILHPFKKFNGSCTFATISNQWDTLQYQHIPMNPHLEFQ